MYFMPLPDNCAWNTEARHSPRVIRHILIESVTFTLGFPSSDDAQ